MTAVVTMLILLAQVAPPANPAADAPAPPAQAPEGGAPEAAKGPSEPAADGAAPPADELGAQDIHKLKTGLLAVVQQASPSPAEVKGLVERMTGFAQKGKADAAAVEKLVADLTGILEGEELDDETALKLSASFGPALDAATATKQEVATGIKTVREVLEGAGAPAGRIAKVTADMEAVAKSFSGS